MSTRPIIVCPECRSYRVTRERPTSILGRIREYYWVNPGGLDLQAGRYLCGGCGTEFWVRRPREHVKHYRPDPKRCMEYDRKLAMELAERNHRYSESQPADEVVDLYRCKHYGETVLRIVRHSASVLY